METLEKCSRCGLRLSPQALDGGCLRCMAEVAFGPEEDFPVGPFRWPQSPGVNELAEIFPELEILAPISRGAAGVVYKALQPGLGRIVALKILSPQANLDPIQSERLIQEARVLARLNHPNIVTVY